jgi:polyhydroxyalkanoate synthesis regulator phasin
MSVSWSARELARRLQWACAMRAAVWWSSLALLVWGSAIVVARLVWPASSDWLLIGLAGVLAAAVIGAWNGMRRVPDEASLLAWLDAENACGGLLMSRLEVSLDGWHAEIHGEQLPKVAWKKRPALALLAVSLAYVGVGLWLPQRFLQLHGTPSRAAERQIERLEQQLQKLHDLGLVDTPRYDELRAELQQIRRNSDSYEPGKSHEALDHLERALQQLAQQGVQKWAEQREQLQEARNLAEALKELTQSGELKPEQSKLASQALQQLLQQSLNAARANETAKELQDLLEQHKDGSPFTNEELAELAEKLKELLDGEALDLDELAELGLLDPELLRKLKDLPFRPVDLEWIKACLEKCEEGEGDCDAEELLLLLCRGKNRAGQSPVNGDGPPGVGGINRGRGDAPLTFGKPSSAEGVQLKPEALKPGALHHLETPILQVQRVKPTTDRRETSQGGALGDRNGTGEGYDRLTLPRHRRSVRQYFESGR